MCRKAGIERRSKEEVYDEEASWLRVNIFGFNKLKYLCSSVLHVCCLCGYLFFFIAQQLKPSEYNFR